MVEQDLFSDFDFGVAKSNAFDPEEYQSVVLKSEVTKDMYTDYIQDHFDLKVGSVSKVCVPMKIDKSIFNEKWNIGVICGASGSGKSTILRKLCKENTGKDVIPMPVFDSSKTLISNFDMMSPEEASMLLSQVGLASVPTWIRPYNVLSNGEKYRAQLAKLIADSKDDDTIFVDEFTSVVDRNVAMAMSNALQKYIRRNGKRIILATCHYDILDWLRPDWIYDLNKGGALERGDYLRQPRPKIELQVYRTTCDTWERFKKYHYMTSDLNEASTCFVFVWNDKLVAFLATLPLPSGNFRKGYRGHRTVVLPDFQGLGIGSRISEFIAGIYKNDGCLYFTKTINPALGLYRERSSNWAPTSHNLKGLTENEASRMMGGLFRESYCHRYVGEAIGGYEDLLLSADEIKHKKSLEGQLLLF